MVNPNCKTAMVVGEVRVFDPPYRYAHTFQITNIDEPPCVVTYELREKDGGTEFLLIITEAVGGSKLHKEMLSYQGFISNNIRALAETGKPMFTGLMIGIPAPVFAMFAKNEQRIEHWPLSPR